jgi:hypothetical protein
LGSAAIASEIDGDIKVAEALEVTNEATPRLLSHQQLGSRSVGLDAGEVAVVTNAKLLYAKRPYVLLRCLDAPQRLRDRVP